MGRSQQVLSHLSSLGSSRLVGKELDTTVAHGSIALTVCTPTTVAVAHVTVSQPVQPCSWADTLLGGKQKELRGYTSNSSPCQESQRISGAPAPHPDPLNRCASPSTRLGAACLPGLPARDLHYSLFPSAGWLQVQPQVFALSPSCSPSAELQRRVVASLWAPGLRGEGETQRASGQLGGAQAFLQSSQAWLEIRGTGEPLGELGIASSRLRLKLCFKESVLRSPPDTSVLLGGIGASPSCPSTALGTAL